MNKKPKIGDYVLGTKYHDGDQHDPFAIGWLKHIVDTGDGDLRYVIADDLGDPIYGRIRRCERISLRVGTTLVKACDEGVLGDRPGLLAHSIWHWRRNIKKLEKILEGRYNI